MHVMRLLFAASLAAVVAMAVTGARAADWERTIHLLDFSVPAGSSAVAEVYVGDKSGAKVAEGEMTATSYMKTFEYVRPYRYEGDRLIVDGNLLFLDTKNGHENPRLTVQADLRDEPLLRILSGVFLDLAETHSIESVTRADADTTLITLKERGDAVFFEKVKIWADTKTGLPKRAEYYDVENNDVWHLKFAFQQVRGPHGTKIEIAREITVRTAADAPLYRLTIKRFRLGPDSQLHHTATHGME